VNTALVKVGGRWRHRKSGGPPVGRVEPVESAGGAGGQRRWAGGILGGSPKDLERPISGFQIASGRLKCPFHVLHQ